MRLEKFLDSVWKRGLSPGFEKPCAKYMSRRKDTLLSDLIFGVFRTLSSNLLARNPKSLGLL